MLANNVYDEACVRSVHGNNLFGKRARDKKKISTDSSNKKLNMNTSTNIISASAWLQNRCYNHFIHVAVLIFVIAVAVKTRTGLWRASLHEHCFHECGLLFSLDMTDKNTVNWKFGILHIEQASELSRNRPFMFFGEVLIRCCNYFILPKDILNFFCYNGCGLGRAIFYCVTIIIYIYSIIYLSSLFPPSLQNCSYDFSWNIWKYCEFRHYVFDVCLDCFPANRHSPVCVRLLDFITVLYMSLFYIVSTKYCIRNWCIYMKMIVS